MSYKRIRIILISCFAIFYSAVSASNIRETEVSSGFSEADNVTGNNKVSVTYVGNAGFLIEIGNNKILVFFIDKKLVFFYW